MKISKWNGLLAARFALALGALLLSGCATTRFACPRHGGRSWRELSSDHFVLQTDLDGRRAQQVIDELESLRTVVQEALPAKADMRPAGRLAVVAFASHRDYLEFEPRRQNIGTFLWDSFGRPRILLSGEYLREERTLVAHELSHYVAYQAFIRQPRWFAEGMATYLETVGKDGPEGQWSVGAPPDRARYLPLQLRQVRYVLEWTRSTGQDGSLYATSWLLVHYLVDFRPEQFGAFQERLARAEDPAQAWDAAFPEWSLDAPGGTEKLDRALRDYLKAGTWKRRPVPVAGSTYSFTDRLLNAPEVHALRLSLPHRWDARALEAEIDEALDEDPAHVRALARRATMASKDAELLARRAVAGHPEDPEAWAFLARSLRSRQQRRDREAAYRRAIEKAPDHVESLVGLAGLLFAQNRSAEALPFAERAVQEVPWSQTALLVHADVLSALGRCREAASAEYRGLDVSPSDDSWHAVRLQQASWLERRCGLPAAPLVHAMVRRASVLASPSGEPDEVTRLLQEATAAAPDFPDAWHLLGHQYLGAAHYREAAEAFRNETEYFSRHPWAWSSLGLAYLRLSRERDAVRAFRRQIAIDPGHPYAWVGQGLAQERLGNDQAAEESYRRGSEAGGDGEEARVRLGYLLLRKGWVSEARSQLEYAARQAPEKTGIWVALGEARLAAGDRDQALQALERATTVSSSLPIWNNAAYALADANLALAQAEAWATAAVVGQEARLRSPGLNVKEGADATGSLLAAWDTLGWVRFRQGRLEDAERYVAAAVRARPSSIGFDHLGRILEQMGRRDEAREAYASALALAPMLSKTRSRLATVAGAQAIEPLVNRARTALVKRWSADRDPAPSAGAETVDLVLSLSASGAVSSVKRLNADDPPEPANALLRAQLGVTFPDGSVNPLFLRASYQCRPEGCTAVFPEERPSRPALSSDPN
jgi:tetratricopeptide (TPR) repeat protein